MKKSASVLIGDAVGVGHFVVCNVVLLAGQFLPLFQTFGGKHPGLRFIYQHIDAMVYEYFKYSADARPEDVFYTLGVGELIILLSSVIYGFAAYVLLKAVIFILD